ncbi:MAG: hypothetical protein KatS3mg102_0932 [Planctomycetota bacterium]|nr:MAG: hypothetical protein KatS3mg102_0932 [Planctomycetota bacterium]
MNGGAPAGRLGADRPGRARSGRWRRAAGLLLALSAAAALGRAFVRATDFPTAGEPIRRVDAALLAYLRAHPGQHLPLAPSYTLAVPLALVDDAANRWLFGTTIDLREPVPRRSIHIQKKGERLAIHADAHNPRAGLGRWLLHATLDVPVLPLVLALLAGAALATAPGRGERGFAARGPAR